MYGCQVSVSSQVVSAQTTLNYLLQFSQNVQTGDYLNITLPQQPDPFDTTGCNFVTGRAFCAIQSPLTVSACQISSLYSAQITYKLTGSTAVNSLQGSIYYFNNPDSADPVENIQFALVSSSGTVKSVCANAQINSFQPTTLTATLASSSSIVGATGATLSVTVTPQNILAAAGQIVITIPEYYTNAGTEYMISGTVQCSAQSGITVSSCNFQSSSKTVTILYSFNNNVVSKQAATFYINNCFRNPITPEPKSGFFVATFDQNQYAIGLSANLSLTGISTPNTYNYITFAQSQATVGQLDQLQINIGMNAPLPTQCFLKFIFPQEFAINSNLYQATGNSFFVQQGQANGIIPFYSINIAQRSVVVQACQVYSGQNKVGSITFNSVVNPFYITDTGSFSVIVSKDANFTQIIASQTTGLVIPASSFSPGVIVGKVTTTQNLVSATAPYSFTITAPTSIAVGGSKIVITMPPLVSVSKVCAVTKLSATTTCSVAGQVITLLNPFSSYIGGVQLSFTVGDITNPISVRDIGTIQIQTFIQIASQFYLVDQVYLTNQITPVNGVVNALQQTSVSSYVTYDSNTVYIFSMNFQHTIPVGSTIRASLPPGTRVNSVTQFQSNCYRLDKTQVPQKLTCTVNSVATGFDVSVTSQVFGASGLQGLETFKLQVVNIVNPRTLVTSNLFKFQSLDSLGYVIDVSIQDPLFSVTMTTLSQMQLISFGIANATNGAVTSYTMTITPNTPLYNQDSLTMTFPKEITLPSLNQIVCSGSISIIVKVICTTFGNNQVVVKFTLASTGISAGQSFNILFQGIQNAVSTRPTSTWSQFQLADVSNYGIATYSGNVQVTNKIISNIQTYSLSQDTKEPDVQAFYTITFSTNNPIPYSAAMTVLMPMEVALVRDSYSCFVLTNTRQNMVCSFQGNNILKIQNAFNNQPTYYTGTVVVTFVAQNPSSNANTNITLQLTVYDKSDFAYPIDQILSGLNPTFVCNFPCLTCSAVNPSSCVTCPTGINKPIYLQILPNNTSTCQTACNPGFTYNSLSASNVCIPCDSSCATCRVGGGGSTDQEYCLTCSSNFPVYWKGMNKCYTTQQGCPNGSWMSNVNTCKSCTSPCLDCISATLCNYCDPFSKQPLLQNSVCVSTCSYGFTPLYTGSNQKGVCAPCQPPCATCAPGLPQKCLTCATGTEQFLFGSQCVSKCPKGTAIDMVAKRCTGCPDGCNICSSSDNSICLVCEPGLSMLSNECFANCPIEYIKSVDGSTCELRQYPLDKYYAPFPFLAILALFYAIIIASWILTRRQTLLCQNMIAATAFILIVAEIFQFLQAIQESAALTIVQTILILIANLIVNVVYQVSFSLQVDDYKFNLYVKYHGFANKAVKVLCVVFSLHLHRLVYSKLFALPIFHAATTSPDSFYRPLLLYSQIQIASIAAPILFSNIYYAVSTNSDYVLSNQLQCTNIELILISFILICLVLYEKFYQHPRFLNFKADHDALNTFQTVFGSNDQFGQGISKEEFTKLQSQLNQRDRLDRHKMLKQVIGAVRSNKDTLINLRLDYILDEEIIAIQNKQDSMPDLMLKPLHTEDSQENDNYSWEGVLPNWNDAAEERLKLLAWMEQQLQQAAEKERQQFDKQQLKLRFQDKESMYDNQMFDNVFFSQKTLRVNEFEHHEVINLEGEVKQDRSFQKPHKEQAQKSMQTDAIKSKSKQIQVLIKDKPVKPAARHTVKPPVLPIPVLDNYEESEDDSIQDGFSQLDKNSIMQSERFFVQDKSAKSQVQQVEDEQVKQAQKSADRSELQYDRDLDNSLTKLLIQESIFDNQQDLKQQHSEKQQQHSEKISDLQSKHKSKSSHKSKHLSQKVVTDKNSSRGSIKKSSGRKSQVISSYKDKVQESLPLSFPSLQQSEIIERDQLYDQDSYRSHYSNMTGKMHTLDHLVPGPETKMWQDRVTLFKTLLLDCRPSRGNKIFERQNDSITDPTQQVQDPNGITEINIVEDLADSAEQYEDNDDTDDSIDDAWFAQQPPNDWQHDNININMRNFNIFSVLGNFPLDNQGRIINRQQVLEERNYKDLDGFDVNSKGYLINDTTGAIYSKFTFEDLFMPITSSVPDYGELPMPYRLERFNFNPHSILGNFDFDQLTRKPIFLKNKFGILTDKNYRPVNKSGFLINANEDIISDDGEIKFMNCMLLENGNLPLLYNYQGKEYNIKDIIGQLRKDPNSKELMVKIDKNTQKAIDEQLRPVNANGYLVNENGSIINQEGEIIFNFWELSCQEPPKLFKFTEWSVDWVKGRFDPRRILGFAPGKDNIFDLDGKMINIEGYLIDKGENVIDKYGRIVFKTDLLTESSGQDAKIPAVFTMGILSPPQVDTVIDKEPIALSSTIIDNTTMNKSNDNNITVQNQKQTLLNETAQSAQLSPENHELKQKKHKKRKLKRQQSTASEGRYGKKIINQYQHYLENNSSSSKPFSSLVAGMSSAQQIKPILAQRPPIGSDYAHKEELRSATNPRLNRNHFFNSDANLSMTPNSVVGRRVQVNQYMHDPSPISVPRAVAIPDNSYAARAESIFNQTKFLSQQDDLDMFNLQSNIPSQRRNDSRNAISQQLDDIQEIYSSKKRPL